MAHSLVRSSESSEMKASVSSNMEPASMPVCGSAIFIAQKVLEVLIVGQMMDRYFILEKHAELVPQRVPAAV